MADAAQKIPAFCTQCRSRCGCVAVIEHGRLTGIEPLPGHPTGDKLCPKGRAAPELVYHADRLTRPLRRTTPKGSGDPGWRPVAWVEALDEIATRMATIARSHGPEQVAFSVTTPSGTHITDSVAWIQRLTHAFGSPNTINATEICNWHKDYACRFTYGHDIGVPDFAHTGCVVLWGNNPTATWLARSNEIQAALRRGARLVVVDPRPTALARRADQWLQVRPGTDQMLALGLAHLLIESNRFDTEFATRWTNGPLLVREDTGRFLRESDLVPGGREHVLHARAAKGDRLLRYDAARGGWLDRDAALALRAACSTPIRCVSAFELFARAAAEHSRRVAKVTGVAPPALAAAAEIIAAAPSVAYYCWNGVGQSITATQTDRAISILYALTGHYGRRGGNVPGSAAAFGDISGKDLLSCGQRAKTLGLAGRPLGPGRDGWVTARDVYRAVLERDPYPVRMLMSFGGNLLASHPDTELARRALERLEFHVHADFFVNPTARHADIILPVATSWEREGLRTGFDVSLCGQRRVQLRPAVIAPLGQARSDTDIVLGLAKNLGLAESFFGCDADRGHDSVLAPAGLSVARLRDAPAGVEVDGEVALDAHMRVGSDGSPTGFPTPTRRVEIYSEHLLEAGYRPLPSFATDEAAPPDAAFPLRLGSAKTVVYCHSQHRNIASLRRLAPDPVVEIAPPDAQTRSIAAGDWVRIRTRRGTAVARATIVPGLAAGAVFGQHGWWADGAAGTPYDATHPFAANINNTIDSTVADPISGSTPLRCSWCEVEKMERSEPH